MKHLLACVLPIAFLAPVNAKVAPPRPPEHNKHAPQTSADKARVKLALTAVNRFLRAELSAVMKGLPVLYRNTFKSKSLKCLLSAKCVMKDIAFGSEVKVIHQRWGRIVELRHAHIIPWTFKRFLKQSHHHKGVRKRARRYTKIPLLDQPAPILRADEYMVHAYVRFDKRGGWHHLDVIMTEDAKGNPAIRHFFVTHMRSHTKLPPGVKC